MQNIYVHLINLYYKNILRYEKQKTDFRLE
jgi:hypothetical protein